MEQENNEVIPAATPETAAPATVITDAEAKEYDYYILVDRSGSMGKDSQKFEGKTRWQEGAEFTESVARYVEKFDDDGLTLVTFGTNVSVFDGVRTGAIEQVFLNEQPSGSTNLDGALKAALEMKFKKGKPAIMFVLTDGEPDSQTAVIDTLITAANTIEKDSDLAIQFIQIGDDPGATRFLQSLDDDLQARGAKFDIVNSLTREQAEGLSVSELIFEALND